MYMVSFFMKLWSIMDFKTALITRIGHGTRIFNPTFHTLLRASPGIMF